MSITPLDSRRRSTLPALVDAFLAAKARLLGMGSAKTVRAYGFDLRRFLADFGGYEAAQLSANDIERYLQGLKKANGTPVSPSTANRHLATLASFFSWLVERGEIESSPVKAVKKAKLKQPEPGALDAAVRAELVERARKKGLREHLLVTLMLATGLRIAEALALNVEDVLVEFMTINVKVGKGNKPRKVYFTSDERTLLKRYLKAMGNVGPYAPLFTSSRDRRLSYQRAASLFKEIAGDLPNLDGRPLNLHQLRHTYCSEQLGKGVNPAHLMATTGHADPRTLARYTMATKEAAAEAEYRKFNR